MPFEQELESKINKKPMGGSLGKCLFVPVGTDTKEQEKERAKE